MTLTGMSGLLRALKEIPDVAKDELRQAVTVTAFAISQRMKATAPRDSGLLISNISSSTRGLTGRVEIGIDPFYWHFLEFGTVKLAATPFIRPSAELESEEFKRRLTAVARTLERAFEQRAA
jgi:HK97 gp10 family phage protein